MYSRSGAGSSILLLNYAMAYFRCGGARYLKKKYSRYSLEIPEWSFKDVGSEGFGFFAHCRTHGLGFRV